jgi:hypothetical protein
MLNFLIKNKKIILINVLVLLMIILPLVADAQRGNTGPGTRGTTGTGTESAGLLDCFSDPFDCLIITPLTRIVFGLFGVLLSLSGFLLNKSIQISVLEMSKFVQTVDGIRIAWEVMRDIANIIFIFTIVYIGISTILRVGGDTKKLLGKVILAALLINFSFFFTSVMIDTSNILTLSIYQRIHSVEGFFDDQYMRDNPDEVLDITDEDNQEAINGYGISGVFMNAIGLTTIFDPDRGVEASLAVAAFGAILILILTFSFTTIAILFIIRLIVLLILLITSPISVLGGLFPKISQYSKQWWDTLWGQLLFAPIFMAMMLIIVLVISSEGFMTGTSGNAGEVAGFKEAIDENFAGGTISIVLNYIMVIGFLVSSIFIAKQTASQGSAVVGKMVSGASDYAAGSLGFVGRRTIGAAGAALADNERIQRWQREGGAVGRFTARTLIATGDKAQKGSFDFRATAFGKGLGDAMGGVGGAQGKGGRKAVIDAYAKRKDEVAKRIGEASDYELEKSDQFADYRAKKDEIENDDSLNKKQKDKKLAEIKREAQTRAQREYAESFGSKTASQFQAKEDFNRELGKVWRDRNLSMEEREARASKLKSEYRRAERTRWRKRIVGGVLSAVTGDIIGGPAVIFSEGNTKARRARAAIEKRNKSKSAEQKIKEAVQDQIEQETPPAETPPTPPPITP